MFDVLRKLGHRYFDDEQAVLFLLLLVGVAILTLLLGDIMGPLLVSVVLAYVLNGLVDKLTLVSLPRNIAVSLATLFLVSLLLLCLLVLLPLIWSQMTGLLGDAPALLTALREFLVGYLRESGWVADDAVIQIWLNSLDQGLQNFGNYLVSRSVSTLFSIAQLLIYLFLVPLLVFFLLHGGAAYIAGMGGLLPGGVGLLKTIWSDMDRKLANYARGKVLEILIVGAVSYLLYALFDLKYALLLAVLTGVSVLVPYIGAFAVTVPVAMVGYQTLGWGSSLMYLVGAYIVLQMLDGNVLVPFLFSEAVSLHPLSILLSVFLFGGLWGFWGVFFAIPLATFIKTVLYAWPRLE